MSAAEIYDQIGIDYTSVRRPDARWVARIHQALDGHCTLVNVGAGAGAYEPSFMSVVGVGPSQLMIRQRSSSAAPVIRGVAEQLPFPDGAFDVALAILTVHGVRRFLEKNIPVRATRSPNIRPIWTVWGSSRHVARAV